MKPRIKSSAIYHAEPEIAKSFMAKSEVLENKLKSGKITKEELMKLAEYRVQHSIKPKREQYFVPCFGKFIEVPKDIYDRYYAK